METVWVETREEFEALAAEWDEAVIASGSHNPFVLAEFLMTWWRHAAAGRALRIWTLRDRGQLVAGIPLCREPIWRRRTFVHIGGAAANLTHGFSLRPELHVVERLMEALAHRRDWNQLVLPRVLVTTALAAEAQQIAGRRQNRSIVCAVSAAGTNGLIDLTKGYEVVMAHLPSRLRRYLRRGAREAQRLGPLELQRVGGSEAVRRLFDEHRIYSTQSCATRNRRSAFEDDQQAQFFRDLVGRFEAKGRLEARKLSAGPTTLAISFAYRCGPGAKWILTSFNPTYASWRPGHLLIEALVREAIRQGDPVFDMYYGGELLYKRQWCTTHVPLVRVTLLCNTSLNRVWYGVEQQLRINPRLRCVVHSAQRLVGGIARSRKVQTIMGPREIEDSVL